MKKFFMLAIASWAIFIFSSYDVSAQNEVGTYSLFKLKENNKEVLYKINTKTGQVWCYDEFQILKAEDLGFIGKEADSLNKLISDANKKKMGVYTLPFWSPTSDKPEKLYKVK